MCIPGSERQLELYLQVQFYRDDFLVKQKQNLSSHHPHMFLRVVLIAVHQAMQIPGNSWLSTVIPQILYRALQEHRRKILLKPKLLSVEL